ncbi:hypothetical protein C2G38_2161287 [Gigaspora rosea]|uniref:Uncharacterized protein n=1 Tax=Gigaspora rosea TaxID=44941 RepID=A0A397VX64_9GLOM|nr:hypothetical protein C2G38_2234652 [Gigaspora rosea]RIB27190.1 hypothetical protein C2G38_2161287 [Gigaspora rosea]
MRYPAFYAGVFPNKYGSQACDSVRVGDCQIFVAKLDIKLFLESPVSGERDSGMHNEIRGATVVRQYGSNEARDIMINRNRDQDWEAREWAVKIKSYNKDNKFDAQKVAKIIYEESKASDVKELTSTMQGLMISQIEKKLDDDIQEIKETVKELVKAIKNFTVKEELS